MVRALEINSVTKLFGACTATYYTRVVFARTLHRTWACLLSSCCLIWLENKQPSASVRSPNPTGQCDSSNNDVCFFRKQIILLCWARWVIGQWVILLKVKLAKCWPAHTETAIFSLIRQRAPYIGLDPTAAAYLQLVYILASTEEPVVIGLCKQQQQQQQLEA